MKNKKLILTLVVVSLAFILLSIPLINRLSKKGAIKRAYDSYT